MSTPQKGEKYLHYKGITYEVLAVSNTFLATSEFMYFKYSARHTENLEEVFVYRVDNMILCLDNKYSLIEEPLVIYATYNPFIAPENVTIWVRPLSIFLEDGRPRFKKV